MDFYLRAAADSDLPGNKGVIIELYGTGNVPSKQKDILDSLSYLQKKDKIVVALTQCVTGKVELDAYAVADQLRKCGVVSAHDMTTAAASTKLSYLFGKRLKK